MIFERVDLSQYNKANRPYFEVYSNGKVDIAPEQGSAEKRIGLSSQGMFKLTREWINEGTGLTRAEKDELIELLKK